MNLSWGKQRAPFLNKKGLSTTMLLVACLTFVGWMSLDKLWELYDSQASMQTIRELQHEISRLRIQYRDAHPENLETNLEQAEHHVLKDFTHLAEWAQELQGQGKRVALHMNYRILKTQQSPASIEGITIVPVELQIHSQGNRSGYRQFLTFLQALEQSGPRINIQEVTVRGDGKKAKHFTVELSTWMKTQNSVEL